MLLMVIYVAVIQTKYSCYLIMQRCVLMFILRNTFIFQYIFMFIVSENHTCIFIKVFSAEGKLMRETPADAMML